MKKKIIVACGSGVATSQTVASRIKSMCEDAGLTADVEAVDIKSLDTEIAMADVYVQICNSDTSNINIPVLSGIPFLTGMKKEEEFAKLKEAITS